MIYFIFNFQTQILIPVIGRIHIKHKGQPSKNHYHAKYYKGNYSMEP